MLEFIKEADAPELFALTDSHRKYLREWLPWVDNVVDVTDTMAFIELSIRDFKKGVSKTYVIRDAGVIVGICGFNKFDKEQKMGSIGYWLGAEFQGRGLMSNACKELEKIALNELQLEKLDILAAECNLKSRAVAERLGYTQVRKITDAEWLYDHYVDHIVYEKNLL